MGVFQFRIGRKNPTPGELAKERLKVLLVHDRLKLNPAQLEIIRQEILEVVSRRLAIDEEQVQVSLTNAVGAALLYANMPIRREKAKYERGPPSGHYHAYVLQPASQDAPHQK